MTFDEELRCELVARFEADQRAVGALYESADRYRAEFEASQPPSETPWPFAIFEWQPEPDAPTVVRQALACVRENTARLKQIVRESGWPGRDRVGEDGADAAWLILQHAGGGVRTLDTEENRRFRRECVPLLQEAVLSGRAHPRHLAHTVDGIRSVEGGAPVFGVLTSQYEVVDGRPVFAAAVDLQALEHNRRTYGLASLTSDVQRRVRGEPIPVVGPDRSEPWLALT